MCNLCSGEEEIIRNMPDSTGDDSQCHSWEHIGVVSLAGEEGLSVGQGYFRERTPTCKYTSALLEDRQTHILGEQHLEFILLFMT